MSVFKQGTVFAGRYFLEELIGEGGFSEVWKVHDVMTDDAVMAVKIYAPEKGLDDYGIRQFRQEFSITHPLSHPHLMKVNYFDIADGSPYLIMPYYQFGSLAKQLQEKGLFSEKQIALLMCQMGSALEELHEQQPPVLHQDIKPDNILVSKKDQFILADFGISSNTRQTLRKSTTKFKPLTIGYAPPERFDRNPVSNTAGDIFSLGVTMYEICTGQIPWDGNGGQSLLKGAYIPALPAKFPKELNRMLEACMAADWTKRPSADEVMNWGKFYLEQGYWKFEKSKSEPGKLRKYAVPVGALSGVVLAGTLIFASVNKPPVSMITNDILSDTSVITENPPTPLPIDTIGKGGNTISEVPIEPENDEIKPAPTNSNPFTNKNHLENYLDKISNSKLSRTERDTLKNKLLKYFSNDDIPIINMQDSVGERGGANVVLGFFIDIPHHIKVNKIETNKQQKITSLELEYKPL